MNRLMYLVLILLSIVIVSCQNGDKQATTTEVSKSSVKAASVQKVAADTHSTGDLSWHSMNDIEAVLEKDKKKILVDVYTKWCGPCKMMDRNTFTDATVQAAINEKFHPVKFDAEGASSIEFNGKTWENPNHDPNKRGRNSRHQLASFFAVPGYPTLVILDENFNVIRKIVGYKTPDKLMAELNTI